MEEHLKTIDKELIQTNAAIASSLLGSLINQNIQNQEIQQQTLEESLSLEHSEMIANSLM